MLGAATTVYQRAFSEPPYGEGDEHGAAFGERVRRYAGRSGFRLALCRDGGAVLGLALSVHARAGDWWRDRVAESLGPQTTAAWLEPVIREVVHVAVDPTTRRRGVGRLLTEDALDEESGGAVAAVVLSCHPEAPAARSLYRSCGFEVLSSEFRTAPGQLGFLLMARRGHRRPE